MGVAGTPRAAGHWKYPSRGEASNAPWRRRAARRPRRRAESVPSEGRLAEGPPAGYFQCPATQRARKIPTNANTTRGSRWKPEDEILRLLREVTE